ncbi:NAD-dependent epimerase/dehydratase family protein [Macrococcus sp. EM39E]|uniref:NAD-dependent epimerase/dehydratase family protein n=1 Tax=Macrococcus animalis TaxID=3395467 RepID=UPI0039BE86A9
MGKHVLITGSNGYVGSALNKYLLEKSYTVDRLSVRNDEWKDADFSKYDILIHLAALVHNNEPKADMKRFMDVNYKLTKELADKAKSEGVNQFIFFSTMAVFGLEGKLGKPENIDLNTELKPTTEYGMSKLKADEYLESIMDDKFIVSIVRPPMVYGPNSPGNFEKLKKYAEKVPFYLNIDNDRSAIYIDNLLNYVLVIIEGNEKGIFYPTNRESFRTNEVIRTIRELNNSKSYAIPVPKLVLPVLSRVSVFNKLYGNLTYDKKMQHYVENNHIDMKDSICKSVYR